MGMMCHGKNATKNQNKRIGEGLLERVLRQCRSATENFEPTLLEWARGVLVRAK